MPKQTPSPAKVESAEKLQAVHALALAAGWSSEIKTQTQITRRPLKPHAWLVYLRSPEGNEFVFSYPTAQPQVSGDNGKTRILLNVEASASTIFAEVVREDHHLTLEQAVRFAAVLA